MYRLNDRPDMTIAPWTLSNKTTTTISYNRWCCATGDVRCPTRESEKCLQAHHRCRCLHTPHSVICKRMLAITIYGKKHIVTKVLAILKF